MKGFCQKIMLNVVRNNLSACKTIMLGGRNVDYFSEVKK
jgi:hypothetical protein